MHKENKDLIRWMRTYFSDSYAGPSMATDVLLKKGADEIERLTADLDHQVFHYHKLCDENAKLQAVVDVLEVFLDGDIGYEPLEEALAALKVLKEDRE